MDEFVEIYAASDITFAYLMKARLEDAGIPVQIANENVSAAYCIDGMVPRVLVPADRLQEAQQVISDVRKPSEGEADDLDDEE